MPPPPLLLLWQLLPLLFFLLLEQGAVLVWTFDDAHTTLRVIAALLIYPLLILCHNYEFFGPRSESWHKKNAFKIFEK